MAKLCYSLLIQRLSNVRFDTYRSGMSEPNRISMNEAREDLAEWVNLTAYTGARIVLERRGKPVAAIVSINDLEQLQCFARARDRLAVAQAAEPEPPTREIVSDLQPHDQHAGIE